MVLFVLLTLLISRSFAISADGGDHLRPDDRRVHCAGRGRGSRLCGWSVETNDSLALGMKVVVACAGRSYCGPHVRTHDQHRSGARIVNTAHVESLPACLSVTVLPLLLLGGQYEEPGWMGYAQRHRQERFAESVLCLSHSRCRHHPNDLAYAVAGLWHHPPGSTASSGHSRCKSFAPGSMTGLAMIAHLFSNVMAATMKPLFNPADQERYWLTWLSLNASQRSA
jgi:hypothetical protein